MSASIFEGRRVAELSSGAQFALWCLHTRVLCLRTGECPKQRLGQGFELAEIPEHARDFERLFDWLGAAAQRTVYVGCLKCQRVTGEEGLLLAALAAFQWSNPRSAEILLASLMPGPAALNAALSARCLAEAMHRVDLPIGVAGAAPVRSEAEKSSVHAPGSHLVH